MICCCCKWKRVQTGQRILCDIDCDSAPEAPSSRYACSTVIPDGELSAVTMTGPSNFAGARSTPVSACNPPVSVLLNDSKRISLKRNINLFLLTGKDRCIHHFFHRKRVLCYNECQRHRNFRPKTLLFICCVCFPSSASSEAATRTLMLLSSIGSLGRRHSAPFVYSTGSSVSGSANPFLSMGTRRFTVSPGWRKTGGKRPKDGRDTMGRFISNVCSTESEPYSRR